MRLIGQKVDALAVLQLYKFSDERLLTGVSLNYRPRPEADGHPANKYLPSFHRPSFVMELISSALTRRESG